MVIAGLIFLAGAPMNSQHVENVFLVGVEALELRSPESTDFSTFPEINGGYRSGS